MCGRINQSAPLGQYFESLFGEPLPAGLALGTGAVHNVPPGTAPLTLLREYGKPSVSRIFWGYRPHWYDKSPAINARLDTIQKMSPFWRPTLSHRIVVPVNGWYEWTGSKGDKQPWFIHSETNEPLFLAAVAAPGDHAELSPQNGMAIITDASAGGMVDIHDRRPVALAQKNARIWLDEGTPVAAAVALLQSGLPESCFRWHPVTREVGNTRYQSPDTTAPVDLAPK